MRDREFGEGGSHKRCVCTGPVCCRGLCTGCSADRGCPPGAPGDLLEDRRLQPSLSGAHTHPTDLSPCGQGGGSWWQGVGSEGALAPRRMGRPGQEVPGPHTPPGPSTPGWLSSPAVDVGAETGPATEQKCRGNSKLPLTCG